MLVTHLSQEIDVDGSFLIDPSLGDEKSQKFVPEHNLDEFDITTWTLEGRVANLDLVYTGGDNHRGGGPFVCYTPHHKRGGGNT